MVVFGRCLILIAVRIPTILTKRFSWFSSDPQNKLRDRTTIWTRPLPSMSLSIRHLSITHSQDTTVIGTASLTSPEENTAWFIVSLFNNDVSNVWVSRCENGGRQWKLKIIWKTGTVFCLKVDQPRQNQLEKLRTSVNSIIHNSYPYGQQSMLGRPEYGASASSRATRHHE